jgi:hypothetical protein
LHIAIAFQACFNREIPYYGFLPGALRLDAEMMFPERFQPDFG